MVTLAGVAAVPLLLMLLFRVVPLLSIDEIEEAEQIEQMEKTVTGRPSTEPSEAAGHDGALAGATGTSHRVAGATGVLLLVALLGILGVGGADPASAATAPSAPTITLKSAQGGGSVELTAILTGPDGHPLADADVTLFLSTTEFGTPARLVPLGSATTDTTGIARLIYKPKVIGPQEFVATYAPTEEAKPVTASTTVNVTVAQSAYHPPPPKPLAGVGNVLVGVLFIIVAAVWLTLIAQVVRVRRVCRGVQEATTSSV